MSRENFAANWSFALVNGLGREVDRLFPADAHRWPLLRCFDAEEFTWIEGWILLVLKDRSSGTIPSIGAAADPSCPVEDPVVPTVENVAHLHGIVAEKLNLRPQDTALFVPELAGASVEADWELMDESQRNLWRSQFELILTRHWYLLKGFDVANGFFLPPGYEHLADACGVFFEDHPDYTSNVFLMTRFDDSAYLAALDDSIRTVLRNHGLNPVRADDRVYVSDRSLWDNVCVYLLGCSKGIAILEDRGVNEFNPNVAIEYGFMRALNKPTLLLADRGFRNLRADVIGTLREEFDLLDIPGSVPPAIARWLRDVGIAT